MNEHFDLPPAPPPPEEEPTRVGYTIVAILNALLAVYLLFICLSPIIWGQFIAKVETQVQRMDIGFLQQPGVKQEPVPDEDLETYRQFVKIHAVVAISSLVVALSLAFSAFSSFFYEDISLVRTTSTTALAAILLSINMTLGWGGTLSIIAIVIATLETVLLYIPAVQRRLVGVPAVDDEEDDIDI